MTFLPESHASYESYLAEYVGSLQKISGALVHEVSLVIADAIIHSKSIGLLGNGGSASIVDHAQCDFLKWSIDKSQIVSSTNVLALSSNVALLSALNNDLGHAEAFSWLVKRFLKNGDVLIAVSSSGESENILNAVRMAKSQGVLTIGFSGFENPTLSRICDYSIQVNSRNYGVIEDLHGMLFHSITQIVFHSLSSSKSK